MFPTIILLAIEVAWRRTQAMLDTLIKYGGHHWTLLKLPPRRIERRLAVAAHWFAEQLTLHWVPKVDMIFASEALNLADLYRLIPSFAGIPSLRSSISTKISSPSPARFGRHHRPGRPRDPGQSLHRRRRP